MKTKPNVSENMCEDKEQRQIADLPDRFELKVILQANNAMDLGMMLTHLRQFKLI